MVEIVAPNEDVGDDVTVLVGELVIAGDGDDEDDFEDELDEVDVGSEEGDCDGVIASAATSPGDNARS